MLKPFLDYKQQIDNLTCHKGLIINDTDFARQTLSRISYYSLIGGYKSLFYDYVACRYHNGTTFEDIVHTYYFDEALRSLLFQYICHVEQNIRTLYAYHFSHIYSHSKNDYLDDTKYNNTKSNINGINKLISILNTEANVNTTHHYIVYQRSKYNDVPLWSVMQTLTLGQLAKMYLYAKPAIRTAISKSFPSVNERELSQHLKVLTHCRNICAHNERLYCCQINASIPDTLLHQKLNIPLQGQQYIYGKTDLFAVIISLRYLLPKKEFAALKKKLGLLIDSYLKSVPSISENTLLNAMGFPQNWKKITQYRRI